MERKNKKLIVIVSCLLLVISVSLAYYIGELLISGEGATGNATTAKIKGATIKVEGMLEFNDPDILPGHKTISSIKVTATGNNELIPYNLVWKGTNGISRINYTVYKTSTEMNVSASCEKKTSVQNGVQILNEECTITNIDNLGSEIASGSIVKNSTKEILAKDEFITAVNDGVSYYYYVILEYPNLDEDQSSDINATFNGEVTVEESNASPDINILAVYIGDETGNYIETTDIPQRGYVLSEKSTCSNNAVPVWDYNNGGLLTTNLTKSGTSCYLYFDMAEESINTVLGTLKVNTYKASYNTISVKDDGIFKVEDGMYGGYSYYWRGAATTNYLKFGGYCWRIIRINGDGTIRLVYDGTTCHANGTSTADSIAMSIPTYSKDGLHGNSEYVGYTFTEGLQRPSNTSTGTESNLKKQTESWYTTNIVNKGYDAKVAEGKFCNDRTTTIYSWLSQPATDLFYAGYERSGAKLASLVTPTLSCSNIGDVYTLKAGSITMDEVIMAGGKWETSNNNYYLYNGQSYWTMTPISYSVYNDGKQHDARVFYMGTNGGIALYNLNLASGIRPIINLKADIQISGGNGTLENPYIVAD